MDLTKYSGKDGLVVDPSFLYKKNKGNESDLIAEMQAVGLNVSFLNPGIGDKLFAEGRIVKTGKSIVFCEADIWVYKNNIATHTNRATSTMHQIAF